MKWLVMTALLVAGCGDDGPPSQLQTCKDACAFQRKCNPTVYTDADVKACQLNCDTMQATFDANDASFKNQCKNASSVLQTIHDCYSQDCDTTQAQSCAQAAASSCVLK